MKTGAQLRADVQEELTWEPSIRESEIGVAVKDGVVTLTGFVGSYAQKFAAERAAERVSGVRAIADDLVVKLPTALARTDTEIAHAVVNALDWDIEVPTGIVARVENGWVNLDGTVEWQYERSAADRAVRYLTGVKGVSNLIIVKPRLISTVDVSQRIRDALRRSAEMDASRITVEAHDGIVTLKGKVRSWSERTDAERAAWAAPGVSEVDDRIMIGA
jgi:osmotically-inducible protein OsmY